MEYAARHRLSKSRLWARWASQFSVLVGADEDKFDTVSDRQDKHSIVHGHGQAQEAAALVNAQAIGELSAGEIPQKK